MRTVMSMIRPAVILLVEDNPGDVALIREAMADNKISNDIHHVWDGVEAMNYLRSDSDQCPRPDLILLDLNLPRMDGCEVLQAVKRDSVWRNIPVVVLTSSDADDDIARVYGLSANCYVRKPLDLAQFIRVVKSIQEFWVSIVRLPATV